MLSRIAIRPIAAQAARASLLEPELMRCVDGQQVLRVGAATQLPLTDADLHCFLGRLKAGLSWLIVVRAIVFRDV